MAEAGDREQLGDALEEADDDGFEVTEVGTHEKWVRPCFAVSTRFGATLGPAKTTATARRGPTAHSDLPAPVRRGRGGGQIPAITGRNLRDYVSAGALDELLRRHQ
ncbi:hypothetical protein MANY_21310 [Mycolicibacterium anyangense]|uniref:Uncharacterized protein n=1 Tax=Mycolicibacterium anyangense TaxID=1431246 RepID=A0A6N4W9T5_9MYCO|nr:hypothetical protein MANY_21310 [Mycolicibacterium anyangense]